MVWVGILDLRLQSLRHVSFNVLVVWKLARLTARVDELVVDPHFEDAVLGRNQPELSNLQLVGTEQVLGQADGLGLILSGGAILNGDRYRLSHRGASLFSVARLRPSPLRGLAVDDRNPQLRGFPVEEGFDRRKLLDGGVLDHQEAFGAEGFLAESG